MPVLFTFIASVAVICCYIPFSEQTQDCGHINNTNQLPWTVNIYEKADDYDFICYGTIISAKLIVTSARCFYSDFEGKMKNSSFAVDVGTSSQNIKANNKSEHFREISNRNVKLPEYYNGLLGCYEQNIALIVLADTPLNLTSSVHSACIYWDNSFRENNIDDQSSLKSTWTKDNGDIKVFDAQYIDDCSRKVSKNFIPFLTTDKICVQNKDTTNLQVQQGSGLFIFNSEDNRWYLIGISSDQSVEESQSYLIYTKISSHMNWISVLTAAHF